MSITAMKGALRTGGPSAPERIAVTVGTPLMLASMADAEHAS